MMNGIIGKFLVFLGNSTFSGKINHLEARDWLWRLERLMERLERLHTLKFGRIAFLNNIQHPREYLHRHNNLS